METDQRRDRISETAAAASTTNNAALSMTAGSLILGVLLAPSSEHSDRVPRSDPIEPNVIPDEAAPHLPSSANVSTSSNVPEPDPTTSNELSHGPDVASWRPPVVTEANSAAHDFGLIHDPVARLSSEISEETGRYSSGHGAGPTGEPTSTSESRQHIDLQAHSAAISSATANVVDRLVADPGHGLDPLVNSLLEMSTIWQQATSTIDHTVTELITTIEGLSTASILQDLGDTLHVAADRIVQGLELPTLGIEPKVHEPSVDAQDGNTIDLVGIAGTGATLLDALPTSLLGGPQANPRADGVLAQAFGSSVPQSETLAAGTTDHTSTGGANIHTSAFDVLDLGSFSSSDTGPVTLGFIGQSYIDAFDAHDVTHHASHSPLHGLV